MEDKATFPQRLAELRLNPDALEEVRVEYNGQTHVIPNAEGKRGSLQVYAAITSNDSRITPEAARKGLAIFGEELRREAREAREMPNMVKTSHPSIDLLEDIAAGGQAVPSYVIRRAPQTPFSKDKLEAIASEFGTPFIIYNEAGIRDTLRTIYSAFAWNFRFKEYFAVKACPIPHILEICKDERAGADCSSGQELTLASRIGLGGENIMFTSNNTQASEFRQARDLGVIVNFDDITHIDFFERYVGALPEVASVRFNPGSERISGGAIFGNPTEQKYGMTRKQVFEAIKMLREKGVERIGIHTMFASNCLDPLYHIGNAEMLFNLVGDVKRETGVDVPFINQGGGWGVGYKPEQRQLVPNQIGQGVGEAHNRIIVASGLKPLKIFMENGRFVTGPHGLLVTRAIHEKHIYRDYIGVDACMSDFARPGAYGADVYHHVTIAGKESAPHNRVYDIVGSLCENCDKFTLQRALPEIEMGDLVILHGAGAHGRAMGGNYNGKLRCRSLLQRLDGKVIMIQRAETPDDYFATFRGFEGAKL